MQAMLDQAACRALKLFWEGGDGVCSHTWGPIPRGRFSENKHKPVSTCPWRPQGAAAAGCRLPRRRQSSRRTMPGAVQERVRCKGRRKKNADAGWHCRSTPRYYATMFHDGWYRPPLRGQTHNPGHSQVAAADNCTMPPDWTLVGPSTAVAAITDSGFSTKLDAGTSLASSATS